ncbi:MAG TPA: imidazole glycerol phosphate synthase subunit HisH [Chitinophagaceae bacterium]|nr:imidazole glycerol phosphate synthase subunit HisH [Chitinophagaceae bacterium]
MVVIIDYKAGNVGSIQNMLKRIGINSTITSDIQAIENASKLILPGVGHFDYGMHQLHASGLVPLLTQKVLQQHTPILGICLGVQLFTEGSEEGVEKGLGWIKGRTVAFDRSQLLPKQKVPHMGWATVADYQHSKLFEGMPADPRFYFVHSYHLQLEQAADCLVKAHYGYDFAAGIEHGNILGVQFHPEKSHKFGMKLLHNFINNY